MRNDTRILKAKVASIPERHNEDGVHDPVGESRPNRGAALEAGTAGGE